MNLTKYKVSAAPHTVYYIPNFITPDEENSVLKHINNVPKPKWTCLSNRRLQDYGGVLHKSGLIPEKLPEWLQLYADKIARLDIFGGHKPNQVLINEYLPGQGIMPHTDGPCFYPTIATISCGSDILLEFFDNTVARNKVCDLLLERFSLVILQDEMYMEYLHSISERKTDVLTDKCANLELCPNRTEGDVLERHKRVSLTIRSVPKILKFNLL